MTFRWPVAIALGALCGMLSNGCADQAAFPDVVADAPAPVSRREGRREALAAMPPEVRPAVLALQASIGPTLLDRHLAAMQKLQSAPLWDGNAVRLLVDGPASFAAMFAAVERARKSVKVQTYIFEDESLGRKMAELLKAKRAQGLPVHLLYDAIGSIATPDAFFDEMRSAGVQVCEFNPVNPLKGRGVELNHRNHSKILIADDAVAYTGGLNVSEVYSSGPGAGSRRTRADQDARKRAGWRDTQVEVGGPAVAEFSRMFAESWISQGCAGAPPAAIATPARAGDKLVRVVGGHPRDGENEIYIELLSALRLAEKRIAITMAYFVPDAPMMRALESAARRGVTVEMILPGFSDSSLVLHAGRSYYRRLLDAGVKIYERKDALLHAKTAVIDGAWSMVGSANIDWRSFVHNDEVGAVVLGVEFARSLEALFEQDRAASTPIQPAQWARRGLGERLMEGWGRLWAYWL